MLDEKLIIGPVPKLVQITNVVGLAVIYSMWVVAVLFLPLERYGIHVENGNWLLLVVFGSWLVASMVWLVLKVLIGVGKLGYDEAGLEKLISDGNAVVIDVSDIVKTEKTVPRKNKRNHIELVMYSAKDVLRLEIKQRQYSRLVASIPAILDTGNQG